MIQRMHTALSRVKGIKRAGVAVVLVLSLVLTATVYTRPVHAEVFNSKKSVQCTIRILWFQGCRTVTNQGEANKKHSVTGPYANGRYSERGEAGSSGDNASDSVVYPPLDITVSKLDADVPALPAPVGATSVSSQSSARASVLTPLYTASDDTAAASYNAPLRTTGEGWYILGAAWYWWLAGITVVGMLLYGFIQRRRRTLFVLAK